MKIYARISDQDVCDFCSSPEVVRVYAAEDFVLGKDLPRPHLSEGAWSACRACGALIDTGKWNELTHRAFESILTRHDVAVKDLPTLYYEILELHARFRQHMRRDA